MTGTLALLRHAKSSYPAGVGDHERPLSARGIRDASAAGHVLAKRVGRPDLVLVSSAARARQTWDLASAAWPTPPLTLLVERIYDATDEAVLDAIHGVPTDVSTVVVVGHVPGVSELAIALSGSGDTDSLSRMREKFPTSGLACLTVDAAWPDVQLAGGCLLAFDVPRG